MWIREALASDLPPLCRDMREADAAEIYPLRDHCDPQRLAGEIYAALPFALTAQVMGLDSVPTAVAFLGVWPKDAQATLGEAAMFATPAFPALVKPFIRHVRSSLIPSLIARGVRRVECRALSTYAASKRLIRALGAIEEGTLVDLGPDGMDFTLFAWRAREWGAKHVPV